MGHVQSGRSQGSRLIIQSNHDKAHFYQFHLNFFFFDFLIFDIGIFHVREKVGPLCLTFLWLLHIVYPFCRQIFGFPYLSLKLSLTLPHKEKMLWCSYFKSLIKLANFSRCGNFVKKLNLVSSPWKIIVPLGNSVGDHIWITQIHLGG